MLADFRRSSGCALQDSCRLCACNEGRALPRRTGQLEEAEALCLAAMPQVEASFGRDDDTMLYTLTALARVRHAQGVALA